MTSTAPSPETPYQPCVILVGAGVVGCAIAQAHVDARVSFSLVDLDPRTLSEAIARFDRTHSQWRVSSITEIGPDLPTIHVVCEDDSSDKRIPIVIESIAERLDAKRDFFSRAEQIFSEDTILCSNTSTLRINSIAAHLQHPERFCGMHFFMPVDQRPAVEVIRGETSSESLIDECGQHARRIGKEPLDVGDGPGFVVNRLLSPYLNEAMLLLCRGVTAEQIERAALAYGMPMSPLELIDYIGTRTMFDAGRVFWQAFPDRLSPAPMLSGMIKRKRLGRACGAGFYDYQNGKRSKNLSDATVQICEKYRRHVQTFRDEEVVELLSIPMWIEGVLARRDRIARNDEQLNLAMRGGLGYAPEAKWIDFFQTMGSPRILDAIEKWSALTTSMTAPADLIETLRQSPPTKAMQVFAA